MSDRLKSKYKDKAIENPLALDAWNRQKAVLDYSLFHGLWTFDVPNRVWEEFSITAGVYAPIASTGTLCTSEDGALKVESGTTATNGSVLRSKRTPRYQPNRGHLYSTAGMIDNPEYDGIRKWGLFTEDNGVYFELEGDGVEWTLYAVVKSDGTVNTRMDLTGLIPCDFDPTKGHLYDIQYQWRGVGNYFFYVDGAEVFVDLNLGQKTLLTIQNPALPVAYESVAHSTDNLVSRWGCVDVTSEGGTKDSRQFASISTGITLLNMDATAGGVAMIGIKVPRTVSYGGGTVENTRNLIASKLTSWSRDEAAVLVYHARGNVATNLDGLTWTDLPDSTAQYLIGGTPSTLNTAFQSDKANMNLILVEWDDLEQKNIVINPSADAAPFYLTAGDILIISVQSVLGTDENSTTLYLSEEI